MARYPAFTELPKDSLHILELNQKLRATGPILVQRINWMPFGNCYWNAKSYAREHGGQSVVGWAVRWSPGAMIEALHHAIWVTADGQPVDITAAHPGTQGLTTFFPTLNPGKEPLDLKFPVRRDNVYVPLTHDPNLLRYVQFYQDQNQLSRQFDAMMKQVGAKWTPQVGWSQQNSSNGMELLLEIAVLQAKWRALEEELFEDQE